MCFHWRIYNILYENANKEYCLLSIVIGYFLWGYTAIMGINNLLGHWIRILFVFIAFTYDTYLIMRCYFYAFPSFLLPVLFSIFHKHTFLSIDHLEYLLIAHLNPLKQYTMTILSTIFFESRSFKLLKMW